MSYETSIGIHPHDGREWDVQCARCGSSLNFEPCEQCGGSGFDGHDCGEDSCCCADPADNVRCGACYGRCAFPVCVSEHSGWCKANPRPGREEIAESTPEWYTFDTRAANKGGAK